MRGILVTCLLLTAGSAGFARAAAAQEGGPRARLFISPMGEPFRAGEGQGDPQDLWFRGADANHDGALSAAEFSADAARFFAVLDRGHHNEIEPEDVEYYETVLVPEIRVQDAGGGGIGGGARRGGSGRGHGGGGRGGHRGGYGGGGMSSEGGSAESTPARSTYGKRGAARFGYFDFPEPITNTDTNFNRGIDPNEFERAAETRFDALDLNHDGKIERKELPRISPGRAWGGGRRGERGGHRERRGGDGAVPIDTDDTP